MVGVGMVFGQASKSICSCASIFDFQELFFPSYLSSLFLLQSLVLALEIQYLISDLCSILLNIISLSFLLFPDLSLFPWSSLCMFFAFILFCVV